ncbi:MAG: class II glutamine amidotransferase [Acidimicrobiaceae bacterium]|nr:class II glutamine amidotransferase [Acidimicrobiaceae bacterium]
MCRVLAYVGPDLPLEHLLLTPDNSLINQTLDPELHPLLQLAGWGFGAWSDHFVRPDEPLIYRRPVAAFYDDNAEGIIPSLQASTMLAHVRAADYDAGAVLTDENCHPFSMKGTPWIMAQNGVLPNWRRLQRELLPHCDDQFLAQMRGTTDTEFLYVLLMSLLDGDGIDDLQRGFEQLLRICLDAMRELDLVGLTKLKLALVTKGRIIGVNYGAGHDGETRSDRDWRELRGYEVGSDEHSLSMVLEPMYVLTGRNFEEYEGSYDVDVTDAEDATSAIFASEPLTEQTDDWSELAFGQMISIERTETGLAVATRDLDLAP